MTYTKNDTFNTDNLLGDSEHQDTHEGIIWNIVFAGEKKLTNLRTDIEKWQLKKELQDAKAKEQKILEYLKVDTFLGIDIVPRKRKRSRFNVVFPIWEAPLQELSGLFNNLFALYFLRNPNVSKNIVDSWVRAKKSIVIEFWVNHEGSSYFIQNIHVVDSAESEEDEDNTSPTQ